MLAAVSEGLVCVSVVGQCKNSMLSCKPWEIANPMSRIMDGTWVYFHGIHLRNFWYQKFFVRTDLMVSVMTDPQDVQFAVVEMGNQTIESI